MKARLLVFAAALVLVVFGHPGEPAHAIFPHYVASETYYHVDVENGGLDVHVEARIQSAVSGDLEVVSLWAMPHARDIKVTRDGTELEFEHVAASADTPAVVVITLDRPLRGKLVAELEMNYSVPAHESGFSKVAPGAVEAMFVSQGPGSFVLIDLPSAADNVLDPGCVLGANQPAGVRDAGFERWVCGEVAMAALWGDRDRVQTQCARMDDRCRQRSHPLPLAAFAQSITDESQIAHLTADIEMSGGTVTLTLKYFSGSREWAQRQFDVAQRALPALEEVFGHPYPHEQALLRQSNFLIFAGALGVAFTSQGEMLIGGDEHTTVHELAHQWAGLNLQTSWLWEGLAEYGTRRVGPVVGFDVRNRPWQDLPYDDPLGMWYGGSSVSDPTYWYGKSGAFWEAFAQAVGGPEAMTQVLSRMDVPPSELPLDGRWFMDVGEEVSGANLDALFLEWVWDRDFGGRTLAERRAAHDLVKDFRTEAAALGLHGLPTDIDANLRAWSFRSIESQLQRARVLLAEYQALIDHTTASGFTPTGVIVEAWPVTSISGIASLIAEHRNAIDSLNEAGERVRTAEADSPAHAMYAEACDAYNAGDIATARALASSASETVFNARASARMIAIAEAEQAAFTDNFLKRIGMIGQDPGVRLESAHEAAAAGEHARALRLARSAFDSWNGAQSRGLKRLALLAGVLSALGFGSWYLLVRLDRGQTEFAQQKMQPGYRIERTEEKPKPSWRDYENTP